MTIIRKILLLFFIGDNFGFTQGVQKCCRKCMVFDNNDLQKMCSLTYYCPHFRVCVIYSLHVYYSLCMSEYTDLFTRARYKQILVSNMIILLEMREPATKRNRVFNNVHLFNEETIQTTRRQLRAPELNAY